MEPIRASSPPGSPHPESVQLVLVTIPDAEVAGALVRTLLEERLVACGSLVPGLTSHYRWEGALQEDAEVLVLLKSTSARLPDLLERIPALHPYEVPEVLALPVAEGHAPYLAWVAASVAASGAPPTP